MGTSLPYARVVSETIRRKQFSDRAVVITGDGGFHFQLNELIHFQKEGLPVTIIYMRNDIYHMGKSGDGPIYHCSTNQFDVLQLVRAYGGDGKRCETIGEFSDYYSRCLDENTGIRLIEMELGEPDASGRRRPIPVAGSEYEMLVDVAVVAIGNGSNPIIQRTTPDTCVPGSAGTSTSATPAPAHRRTNAARASAGGAKVSARMAGSAAVSLLAL